MHPRFYSYKNKNNRSFLNSTRGYSKSNAKVQIIKTFALALPPN